MEMNEISLQIQEGNANAVTALVRQAIDEGISAEAILNEGLLAGMEIIGEQFKNHEVFLPEVLMAARAMNKGTELLKPLLIAQGVKSIGKACIGTVSGDLHDIGKNICRIMLEGKGFEVTDLGVDVPAEKFVQAAKDGCTIVCMSALLTTTMPEMANVIKALEAAGLRDGVKVMIGGAPVNQAFCDSIKADAYTSNAASLATKAAEYSRL